MEKKGESNETLTLPEEVIHHIQSFMTGKEAARSATLSKPWHSAWLTRPTLELDGRGFGPGYREFERFAKKTMQRYQDSSLNIKRFRLFNPHNYFMSDDFSDELIAAAIKLGATDVEIESYSYVSSFPFKQVLESETLLKFSCGFAVSCSRLKSLSLKNLMVCNDRFNYLLSCCVSLEELSLSSLFINPNLFVLPNLKRMLLDTLCVDAGSFFSDFASRFPCSKELTILNGGGCYNWTRIHIASNSLETITFKPYRESYEATFDVPNIRKFIYSGFDLPSLSINGGSKEWELDVTIACHRLYKYSWFRSLKSFLTKCRPSRITSLSINVDDARRLRYKHEFVCEVEAEPLVVENLRIDAHASIFDTLLLRLLGICRPKFVTHYRRGDKCEAIGMLCKTLTQELTTTPNCTIPNRYVLGQFGLKKVNVDVYGMVGSEWRLLQPEKPSDALEAMVEKRMIRFEMIWDSIDPKASRSLDVNAL